MLPFFSFSYQYYLPQHDCNNLSLRKRRARFSVEQSGIDFHERCRSAFTVLISRFGSMNGCFDLRSFPFLVCLEGWSFQAGRDDRDAK